MHVYYFAMIISHNVLPFPILSGGGGSKGRTVIDISVKPVHACTQELENKSLCTPIHGTFVFAQRVKHVR
jgi:hypothetical protein